MDEIDKKKAVDKKPEEKGPPPKYGKGAPKVPRLSFCSLFKYSGACQKFTMFIGILASMVAGATAPSIAIVFGEVVAIFDPNNTQDEMEEGIIKLFKMIGVLCGVLWVFGYLQFACL